MKRSLLSAVLVFSLLFMLISCLNDPSPPEVTTPPESTSAQPEEVLDISKAVIIYPATASDMVFSAASKLCKDIQDCCNIKLEFAKDTLKKESSDICEILIGNTNRAVSAELASGLGKDEYKLAVKENKLIIVGGSEYATKTAVEKFAQSITSSNITLNGEKLEISQSKVSTLSGKVEYGKLVITTDQKNSCVRVFDISSSNEDISASSAIWSFKYEKYNIADTRLREYNGKEVILAAYGSTQAKIVTFDDEKTVVWSTSMAASNPHACELLPCGVVAVASSDGNEIRFFDIDGDGKTYESKDLSDAHGLLYDPTLDILWAIGRTTLTAYEVNITQGVISVKEKTEYRKTIPSDYAHDLQPVYGNTDQMWIATSSTVYVYSKSQGRFMTDFDGASKISSNRIKGISNFDDGSVITIKPDGAFKSWTSKSFTLYLKKDGSFESHVFTSADCDFYKVRCLNKNYQ